MLVDDKQRELALFLTEKNHPLQCKRVVDSIVENGVANLVLQSLKTNSTKALSTALIKRLQQFDQQLHIIHTIQFKAFQQVFASLQNNNIEFVALKGWALSTYLYSPAHARPKTDLDILIEPQHWYAAKQIFIEQGFHNPRGWEPKTIIDQFTMRKKIVEGVFANVDIHLRLTNDKTLQPLFSWEEIKYSAVYSNTMNCLVINKPFALLHAIIHLLHHACNGDFIKLIWFYDIYLLLKTATSDEQQQIISKAHESGLSFVMTYAIRQQHALFPLTQATQMIEELNSRHTDIKYDYLTKPSSRLNVMFRNFKESKGIKTKSKMIIEVFFPPKEEIYLKYGRNSEVPLWLLYLQRIVNGIKHLYQQNSKPNKNKKAVKPEAS